MSSISNPLDLSEYKKTGKFSRNDEKNNLVIDATEVFLRVKSICMKDLYLMSFS